MAGAIILIRLKRTIRIVFYRLGKIVSFLTIFHFLSAEMMEIFANNPENKAELISSWKFIAGDVSFRAMHLFKYAEVIHWVLVPCPINDGK